MEISEGEQLLLAGQQLREQGKTMEALDKLNQALVAFAVEQNYGRFAHALIDRAICWQHLNYTHSNFTGFVTLFERDAEAALEIVQDHAVEDELTHAYYIRGKADMLKGDYSGAVAWIKQALEKVRSKSQYGNFTTRLGQAIYHSGDKEQGVKLMLLGIKTIQEYSHEVDDYTANVWLSGGYMRLADALKSDDPSESEHYLLHAERIITAHLQNTMRHQQLEQFKKSGYSDV